MYEHLENMIRLYGKDIYIQIPNSIFKKLSANIKNKNEKTNIQQSSFAYAYLIVTALLYKYTHFVDIDNKIYIQNADIKELLGYSKTTKTIDSIIKKGGVLDSVGLTNTTKNYPVFHYDNPNEKINNIPVHTFKMIEELNEKDDVYPLLKKTIRNRNFEIKEPIFLFNNDDGNGTLYNYSNTHTVTLSEVLVFFRDDALDNIDFLIYCFIKSKCKGYKNNSRSINLESIVLELGVSYSAFYSHLKKIKDKNYINVNHKGWRVKGNERLEANTYTFLGC